VFRRFLDPSHPEDIREHTFALTAARAVGNTAYRVSAPYLRAIGKGLHASLATMGVALSIGDLAGVFAPTIGRASDRVARRRSMVIGLVGVAVACTIAAASPRAWMFAVGFLGIAVAKVLFDGSLTAWVADRTDYRLRSQVHGLVETSWAVSLLVGIPVCGVVITLTNWRVAFALLAVVNATFAVVVHRRIDGESPRTVGAAEQASVRSLLRASWPAYVGCGFLMTSASCIFITYGAWLQDNFGLSTATVGVVSILFGFGELASSSTTVRVTDKLGKARAVTMGMVVFVPAGFGLALIGHRLVPGIALVALMIIGFEFAIVSAYPLIGELHPEARASSVGLAVGFGTVGRGVSAIVSTRLYDAHGIGAPAVLGSACAVVAALLFGFVVVEPVGA
jgi:DHA1 family inner membrane transport protein